MDRTNLTDLYQKSDFASAFFFFSKKVDMLSLHSRLTAKKWLATPL